MCLGEPTRAKEHHEKALKIRKEIGLKQGEASDYVGLGAVFQIQGRYTEAKEYLETALEIQKETGERLRRTCRCLHFSWRICKAIECHDEALAIAKGIRHRALEAKSYVLVELYMYFSANMFREKNVSDGHLRSQTKLATKE